MSSSVVANLSLGGKSLFFSWCVFGLKGLCKHIAALARETCGKTRKDFGETVCGVWTIGAISWDIRQRSRAEILGKCAVVLGKSFMFSGEKSRHGFREIFATGFRESPRLILTRDVGCGQTMACLSLSGNLARMLGKSAMTLGKLM